MYANQSNRDKVINHIRTQENTVVVITHPKHIFYFTGFYTNPHERFLGLFWNQNKGWTLILPQLDAQAAISKVDEYISIISYTDAEDPKHKVTEWLQSSEVNKFWIEENILTFDRALWLQQAIPHAEILNISPVINSIKIRKTKQELNLLQEAAQLTDKILAYAIQQFKPGMTENDMVAEIEYQAKKLGAEQMSFGTSVLAKEKSALPHGKPAGEPLHKGFMLIDFGIEYRGYCSDMTRTFHIGPWEEEALTIYETVLQAEKRAIQQARVGMSFEELDSIARTVIDEAGYGSYFIHRLGHGMGIDVHEYPSISQGNPAKIEEGMVFTIEPGIYVPSFGGVRIEDAVYMTSEGAVSLTTFPKESDQVLL